MNESFKIVQLQTGGLSLFLATVGSMSNSLNISPTTESVDVGTSRPRRWIKILSGNWIQYSVVIVLVTIAVVTIGLLTGTAIAVLSTTLPVIAVAVWIHVYLTGQATGVRSELHSARQQLLKEASASRVLDGIKALHCSDPLSANARLATAARMATGYTAAVVFDLRDAHGVLAPSTWSYDGQLSHIRNELEPVDADLPGAIAARQGSAIVISNIDHDSLHLPGWAEQSGFAVGIVAPVSRGFDTAGVVYVLSKNAVLPTLNEIEQLELIINFSNTDMPTGGHDTPDTDKQPFRVVDKPGRGINSPSPVPPIRMTGFALNPESERIEMDGTHVSLSPTEFMLMHALASSPEQPVSPVELMERCWIHGSKPADNAVDVAIFRLRKKLNRAGSGKELIRTVRGSGYMFVPPQVNNDSPAIAD